MVCFQNYIFLHTLCFVFLFRFALFYNKYVLFTCTCFYVYNYVYSRAYCTMYKVINCITFTCIQKLVVSIIILSFFVPGMSKDVFFLNWGQYLLCVLKDWALINLICSRAVTGCWKLNHLAFIQQWPCSLNHDLHTRTSTKSFFTHKLLMQYKMLLKLSIFRRW